MAIDRRTLTGTSAVVILMAVATLVAVAWARRLDPTPPRNPESEEVCDTRAAGGATRAPTTLTVRVIAAGLCAPSGIAFLPDGSALVAEASTARILSVAADGDVRQVRRLAEPVGGGEGGLLDIAVPSTYTTDGWVYVYYTTAVDNRVARFDDAGPLQAILTGLPANRGGRIAFGPDGMLYVGTADPGGIGAQHIESPAGKILRVTPDGRPAPGNPFRDSPVWSRGHRDVRGLAWDRRGHLYAAEIGSNGHDELNAIVAGGDYGWPRAIRGSIGPTWTSTGAVSPGGIAIIDDSAYVACLSGERLYRVPLNHEPVTTLAAGEYGRLRGVTVAPDGALWILTSNRDGRGTPTGDDDRIFALAVHDGRGRGRRQLTSNSLPQGLSQRLRRDRPMR
jgi:glucose/arabinose dehydrogenase